MIISIDNWIFDVDIEVTRQYSVGILNDLCECGYCRNFRSAVNAVYPDLDQFLKKFGNAAVTPEELMPYEPTIYEGSYCISGKILQKGEGQILLAGCVLSVLEAVETDYPTLCPQPYFVFRTGSLELPWVLDEDMDEVISPANEPEYLQRMWDRLLQNAPDSSIN